MAKLYNLARMLTATTGTGTITLSTAKTGYLSFASAGISDGDVIAYAITDGANSEIGYGVYTASGTTLTRNVRRSTNSNNAISLSGSAEVAITPSAEDLVSSSMPCGRLTLTSATPVMTSTTTGATTIYYTPCRGRCVPLWTGSHFGMADIGGELSQATTDATKSPAACTTNSLYDLFVWVDNGTYRCTRGPAWSSATSRGTGAGTTELELLQGWWVNKIAITNGPAARYGLYVGTVRTNSSSQVDFQLAAVAAGGTPGKIYVWNAYHRVDLSTTVGETTDSWTYASSTWRQANNSAGMQVEMVRGLNEDAVRAIYSAFMLPSATGGSRLGIGVDSTSAYSGVTTGAAAAGNALSAPAFYAGLPGIGYRTIAAIEHSAAGTATFYGDIGTPTLFQGGMIVDCKW